MKQLARNRRLALAGVVLLTVGVLAPSWGLIPTVMGGVILLAFALSWMARVIIAGEVEALFWLMLINVGVMAIPLKPLPRKIVGVILLVVGLSWVVRRVLRREAEQARA